MVKKIHTQNRERKRMKERDGNEGRKKMLKLWSADFVCQLIVNELWLLILETLLFFGVRFLEEDCKGLNKGEKERKRKKKRNKRIINSGPFFFLSYFSSFSYICYPLSNFFPSFFSLSSPSSFPLLFSSPFSLFYSCFFPHFITFPFGSVPCSNYSGDT